MSEDLYTYLNQREYPGRGIAVGRTPCGKKMRIAYWIMGRSANSRNRIFAETEDGIETRAFDESKVEDPSLIIYHPVRKPDDRLIVTNGDQTDTIQKYLMAGKSFEDALRTRTFEPDGPNFTPRISALIQKADYRMSILKSDAEGERTLRQFFDYPDAQPGTGHLITTYEDNGSPLPSFHGEPVKWDMVHEPFEAFSDHIWEALNPENKVSLWTAQIVIETGEMETEIYNRNK
jgi:IMP cyclohydrolase